MIRRLSTFVLTAIVMLWAASAVSQAESQAFLTRHTRDVVVNGQVQSVGRLPATETMRFDIVLALRHPVELDDFLRELYDPSSSSYRHFVTVKEFTERFGPSQEDYDALIRFAKASGFTIVGGSRDAMDVQLKGTVAAIEKAFHVTMGVYQHPAEHRTFFAPDREPTADLPFRLWHISGLDNYSIPRSLVQHKNLRVKPDISGSCPGDSYCGSDMRAAYYGQTALSGAGQYLGLFQFAGYNMVDVNTYFRNVNQTLNVPIVGISTDGTDVNCVYSQGCDDTEQTIDITQSVSMAPGLATLYVFVGSSDTAIFGAMSTHSPLTAQMSASWVWTPADPATDDPYFMRFAAQGQNFFAAAGDWQDWEISPYAYPPEDAYVTGVGGTDLVTQGAGGPWASETGWGPSGGGISPDGIPIPSWQQLPGVINSQNEGSTTLRNGPDVAAESNFDFFVCADQSWCGTGWGGTSFAAPMWAGFMALINEQALANGNPLIGFINPLIYPIGVGAGYGAAFHDITDGNNGFPCVVGYDLVTGWGSPNGAGLIDALAGLGTGGPVAIVSPTSLKWGRFPVGNTSGPKKLTFTNSGSAELDIANIATSGDFALLTVRRTKKVTPCVNGTALAAGASCVVKVSFTPTQTGSRTGELTFTDNAPGSPQTVPLSGKGE